MESMVEYLSRYKEDMPQWLKNYKSGDKVPFKDFMSGRIGYYPGSGTDGNLVMVGNASHCVHSFIYLDYLLTREELERNLREYSFMGYSEIGTVEWSESDIFPRGKRKFYVNSPNPPDSFTGKDVAPYYVLKIFERNPDRDDTWGAFRFSVACFMVDGIEMYYQLFCDNDTEPPFLFLLQDHGYGCNYDKFGDGGALSEIISIYQAYPRYVICAEHTDIWNNYTMLTNVSRTKGGMHSTTRYLYSKGAAIPSTIKRRIMRQDEFIQMVKDTIADPVGAKPLVVVGPTGTGKSAIVKSACDAEGVYCQKMVEPPLETFERELSKGSVSNTLFEVEILRDFQSMEDFQSYTNAIIAIGKRKQIPVVVTAVPQTEASRVYSEHGTLVDTITMDQIEDIINAPEFNKNDVVNAIMIIGNESLDPATEYLSWEGKPYWREAKDKKEFMVERLDGTWEYDPRIRKLGEYVNSVGGFGLMQTIYSKVVFGEYRGSERGLEHAWAGIGAWRD